MKKRLLLLVLGLIGIAANLIAIPWLTMAILFSPNGARAEAIIVSYDMLGNATLSGRKGQTISANAYTTDKRWGCWLCKLLNWLQPNHCENSVKQ